MKCRPASASVITNTSHSMARANTTFLWMFGTHHTRYRPSFGLESRISIRADRFEACLAGIARNATNKKIVSAWSRRACSGVGSCISQAGCKASTSSCLTDEDLRKQCVFVLLDKGGEVCRAERGLGSGISYTLGKPATLMSGRTTSGMRLRLVSWDSHCLSKSTDSFLKAP